MVKIKKSLTSIAIVLCAAVISLIGPGMQLNAFADEKLYVELNNATVNIISLGPDVGSYWEMIWNIDGQDVELTVNTGFPIEELPSGKKALAYTDIAEMENMLYLDHSGNLCSDYKAVLTASDGYSTDLACDYRPADDYGGDVSSVFIPNNVSLPQNAEYFTLEVVKNPMFSVIFDNVEQYDYTEEEGAFVIVGSNDEALADKHIKIKASKQIGGKGSVEGGAIYSVDTRDYEEYRHLVLTVSGDFDPETMQVALIGENSYHQVAENPSRVDSTYVIELHDYNVPDAINVAIEGIHEGGDEPEPGPQPHPGDPTNGTVTVTEKGGLSQQEKSFYLGGVEINGSQVFTNQDCEFDASNCPATYTNNQFAYNKEADKDTVEITFYSLFIYKFLGGTVSINNTEYQIPVDYSSRASWLSHYGGQTIAFTFDNVPYAASYSIVYDVDFASEDEIYIGNFLWTNDENEKYDDQGQQKDDYIGHSHLELVSLLCHIDDGNDVLITEETENIPDGCVIEYDGDDAGKVGSLVVPDGSVATIRLLPDYGYQVTSFGSNGQNIAVDEGKVAEYTFTIFKGNFHLGAVVEATEDEVVADSEKVKAGSIELGGDELDEGTAMLTVGDADLTDEERERFQQEAGDYQVSTVLSIDLDQIFYDGHGSYWKGAEMKQLDNEATITLELEEGVDGNSVIIVHKKHDGTYEVIPTTYDPETHTITFKTSSFSDYAIASATVTTPNTIDEIMRYVAMFAASLAIFAIAIVTIKKAKKEA